MHLKFLIESFLQMRSILDVRWPIPSLSIEPQHLETYPIQPVLATLEYTGVSCQPTPGVPITTYSLQLIFCGVSVQSCDPRNKTLVQVIAKTKPTTIIIILNWVCIKNFYHLISKENRF